jgi:hypothetical protein
VQRWRVFLLGASLLALAGCGSVATPSTSTVTTTTVTTTAGPTTTSIPTVTVAVEQLRSLPVDDRPAPDRPYRREDWKHWEDIDGDGCDARQQALIAQSITPAQVDPFTCTVVAGDWLSPYDGVEGSSPGDFDIDHVVPLENAHRSGGWQWTAAQRRLFANDQAELLVVSAASNRSKGSKTPDQWRPPHRASWCRYATTWVSVKATWGLTVTTEERDALGQMIDTCTG